MNALVALVSLVLIVAVALFLIGITLYDVRMIKREQRFRRHPYAKKWRQRPILWLYPTSAAFSTAELKDLRKLYRKIVFREYIPEQRGIVLALGSAAELRKDTLLAALRQLADTPDRVIELIPAIQPAQSVGHLLGNYRVILATMVMKARSGLGVAPLSSLFPALIPVPPAKQGRTMKTWNWLYHSSSFALAIILPVFITYTLYLGTILHQPGLFFICTAGFTVFLTIALWSYDHLGAVQKIGYCLLMPATYPYFLLLAWLRPLKMLADVAKAKVPISVSLFARIKDILRIV